VAGHRQGRDHRIFNHVKENPPIPVTKSSLKWKGCWRKRANPNYISEFILYMLYG